MLLPSHLREPSSPQWYEKKKAERGKLCVGERLNFHRYAGLETDRVVRIRPRQGCAMVDFAEPGFHAWRPK